MVRGNAGASRTTTAPDTQRTRTPTRQASPDTKVRALSMIECADGVLSEQRIARVSALGFDAILARVAASESSSLFDAAWLRAASKIAVSRDVSLFVDVDLHRMASESPLTRAHPTWFRWVVAGQWPVDPRRDLHAREFLPRFDHPEAVTGLTRAFAQSFVHAADAGVAGFAINWPQRIPSIVLRAVIDSAKKSHPHLKFVAWAPGLDARERGALAESGFQSSFCSLSWWDYRSPWFIDELFDLRKVGRVIAPVSWPIDADAGRATRVLKRAIATATLSTDGWMLRNFPFDLDAKRINTLESIVAEANRTLSTTRRGSPAKYVAAPWARVGAWLRTSDTKPALTLINSDVDHHAVASLHALDSAVGLDIESDTLMMAPAEVRVLELPAPRPIETPPPENALKKAIAAPRVMIESISPSIDNGQFPAKRTVGETMVVEADVFSDGHPIIAARVLWRTADSETWNIVRMRALGNDRWRGEFPLRRVGIHEYTIEGGIDEFAGLRSGIEKKAGARQDVALDIEEARLFIENASRKAPSEFRTRLRALALEISTAREPASRVLAPDVAELMTDACAPAFLSRAPVSFSVLAERRAASFSSWYELFPRSVGHDGKHGTLLDVIEQLPRIQAMGFDVLYFPPIHPIGATNRKGKNNSLVTQPGEPGSPYAIGAASGGHDAIHPELGTLEHFLALVTAARKHGLELALDFAVQCSPDHPWIKQHPEWFAWRPDGSMRYAENPPKKYEDIVNVDFYAKDAKPALWIALRDVVAFWMKQGVKIFRVDNPHTKPFPFWEWLIADLRAIDPDVIFLAEAFTRPKLMNRLAKIGFAQSYTYFTWRNTRAELETYLKELNTAPVRDFFRPHFFVNTPDINPYFLQTSGRAGFLIRAALAATLSGLWGMYSGFELCEAAALPGKEEYLDSEKYQLRQRDWNAAGNIVAEITRLNRIRSENPALQTHLGVTFYTCSNSNIVYFGKTTQSRDNVVLVAINLDPHHAQEADIEIPLWEFGLDDNAALCAEELTGGYAFDWRGKTQHIRLETENPYRIWRVRQERDR